MYNITALNNMTKVSDVFNFANDVTNGSFVGMLMVALFIIILMVLKRDEFSESLLASSFICFLLSSILSFGGFLNFLFPLGFLTIMAITGFVMFLSK